MKFFTNDVNLTLQLPFMISLRNIRWRWKLNLVFFLELGDDLFEWLLKNDGQVEIMDPFFLKKELNDYKTTERKSAKRLLRFFQTAEKKCKGIKAKARVATLSYLTNDY